MRYVNVKEQSSEDQFKDKYGSPTTLGIQFLDQEKNESMLRVGSVKEIRTLSKTVFSYIENYKEGYELCLPGGDASFPTQIQLFFEEKDIFQ